MSANRSSENKLTHAFLPFLFFSHGFIQIRFGLFDFFVFVLSSKCYLSKLMLLRFCCQKISFLCKHNFCIDEKHTQWLWGTKGKVFHESISWVMKCPWNSISWNALKKIFHGVSFPLRCIKASTFWVNMFWFLVLTLLTFFHNIYAHNFTDLFIKFC